MHKNDFTENLSDILFVRMSNTSIRTFINILSNISIFQKKRLYLLLDFDPWCNWQHVGFWFRRVQVRALMGQQKKTLLSVFFCFILTIYKRIDIFDKQKKETHEKNIIIYSPFICSNLYMYRTNSNKSATKILEHDSKL